jgi:hypothetical protein
VLVNSNVVSALGIVIIGVAILAAVRRRRGTGGVGSGPQAGVEEEADVGEP